MAPDQSHCYPCSWPGGKVVLLRSTRGVRADHLPAMAAGQDFLTTGDQDSLLKQILLSLFHESKAWLLPVPLRLGFFLVSPTPASHAVGGRPGTAAPGGRQQLPLSQHVVQGKGRRVQDGSRFLAEQLETGVIINWDRKDYDDNFMIWNTFVFQADHLQCSDTGKTLTAISLGKSWRRLVTASIDKPFEDFCGKGEQISSPVTRCNNRNHQKAYLRIKHSVSHTVKYWIDGRNKLTTRRIIMSFFQISHLSHHENEQEAVWMGSCSLLTFLQILRLTDFLRMINFL